MSIDPFDPGATWHGANAPDEDACHSGLSSHMHRPDHPDFRLMSEIVIANDEADNWDALLAPVADPESVFYMADNRAGLAMRGLPMSATMHRKLRALWVDAFVLGAQYRQRKIDAALAKVRELADAAPDLTTETGLHVDPVLFGAALRQLMAELEGRPDAKDD